jgi:DNA-binding transcriptional MerR regulator
MLTIGDFSRATLLTIKTLRHYHDTGLLEAAEVDPRSGYRRYLTGQIPQAQMIKRFRELQMPLNEIRQLLASPDGSARNTVIAVHPRRLENDLGRTRNAVSELRSLLGPPAGPVSVSHCHIAPMSGAAIGERVDAKHAVSWLAELHSTLVTQSRRAKTNDLPISPAWSGPAAQSAISWANLTISFSSIIKWRESQFHESGFVGGGDLHGR